MITNIPDRERTLQAEVDRLTAELARLRAVESWDRDVFKGVDGLRKLLDSQPYWDEQSYGTRLYFGPNINDYLHRDVLRAAVEYLERAAPPAQPAEPVQRLSDERAAFEAWHNEYRTQELVRRDDTYYNTHVRCRWEGWQARAIESALQPGWRDIESAPKDGSTVIVGRDMGHFGFIRGYARWECSIDGLVPGWISCGFDPVNSNLGLAHPTHWMPLPPAPKASHDPR